MAAEVLWRGAREAVSEDVTRRLAEMREILVGRGFGAGVVQMEWCLSNPGGGSALMSYLNSNLRELTLLSTCLLALVGSNLPSTLLSPSLL